MPRTVEGIVRGGRIELIDGPELAEGQRVQILIEPRAGSATPEVAGPVPEEGIIHTPLEDPVLIDLLDRIRRHRRPFRPSPAGMGRSSAAGTLVNDATWDEHLRDILESRQSDTYREIQE